MSPKRYIFLFHITFISLTMSVSKDPRSKLDGGGGGGGSSSSYLNVGGQFLHTNKVKYSQAGK